MELKSFCFTANSAFDDRNKEYGAYMLRLNYDRRVTIAVLVVIFMATLGFGYPSIENWIMSLLGSKQEQVKVETIIDKEVVLEDIVEELPKEEPPKIDIDVPPPPPAPTVAFVPPVIKDEVEETVELTTNEEVKDKVISTVTVDADGPPGDFGSLESQKGGGSGETGIKVAVDNDKVVEVAQVETQFPGGIQAFYKAVRRELRYPRFAEQNGVQGQVFVRFIIEKDGSMSNIEVVRGVGSGLDEEATRVLNKIASMYKWIPAQQNGVTVRQRKTLPIQFKIAK